MLTCLLTLGLTLRPTPKTPAKEYYMMHAIHVMAGPSHARHDLRNLSLASHLSVLPALRLSHLHSAVQVHGTLRANNNRI